MTNSLEPVELEIHWRTLALSLEYMIKLSSVPWTIQTHSKEWENGPYIQAQIEDDKVVIELTSDEFLEPQLTDFKRVLMNYFGWNPPEEFGNPNYWIAIPLDMELARRASYICVRTLIEVYKMNDSWTFELGVLNLKYTEFWDRLMFRQRIPGYYQLISKNGESKIEIAIKKQKNEAKKLIASKDAKSNDLTNKEAKSKNKSQNESKISKVDKCFIYEDEGTHLHFVNCELDADKASELTAFHYLGGWFLADQDSWAFLIPSGAGGSVFEYEKMIDEIVSFLPAKFPKNKSCSEWVDFLNKVGKGIFSIDHKLLDTVQENVASVLRKLQLSQKDKGTFIEFRGDN